MYAYVYCMCLIIYVFAYLSYKYQNRKNWMVLKWYFLFSFYLCIINIVVLITVIYLFILNNDMFCEMFSLVDEWHIAFASCARVRPHRLILKQLILPAQAPPTPRATHVCAANLLPPPPVLSSSAVYHWLTNGKNLQQYAKKPLRQMQVAQATRRLYSWALMKISVARLALASCWKLDRRGENTKTETWKERE